MTHDYHGNALLRRLLGETPPTYSSEDAWHTLRTDQWRRESRLGDVLDAPLPELRCTWREIGVASENCVATVLEAATAAIREEQERRLREVLP